MSHDPKKQLLELETALEKDVGSAQSLPLDRGATEEQQVFENRLHLRAVFHDLFVTGLYIAWTVALVVLVIRAYDLIAPQTWIWMDEKQIQSLDKILFSGAIGGIMGKYINQVLPNDKK